MVLYRLQIDAIMKDQATALAVFEQLKALAPQYAAVGKEGCLFEPSSVRITASSQDTDHVSDVTISDPAAIADIWAYIKEKHPALDPALQDDGIAPSTMRLHDCYHDATPPQPCVISQEYVVTPEVAVALGLPVLGAVVSDGSTIDLMDATFAAKVEAAQAEIVAAEAAATEDATIKA